MFIPDTKDSADLDESMEQPLATQLCSSITTDLTNLSSQQTAPLNSSSSDHPSDQTSRLGDELETDKSFLSAAYLLDQQPPKLVSRSSSFYSQNLHGPPSDIQMTNMLQTLQQSMQPLLEHRPSIDTIDSYVESKLVGQNFIEHQKLGGLDPALLDSSNNALINSFSFDSSTRLSSSSSYNAQHPYFEQFDQTGRCGPTVVLIAHHEEAANQSMCPNQPGISLYNYHSNHHNHLPTSYHLPQDGYPHPPQDLIDSNQIHHH